MEDYGIKLFVGLDVSLAKSAICVISEHGKIAKEAQVVSEPEELVRWTRGQDGRIAAIGLEAGPVSQGLHSGLSAAGRGRSTWLRIWATQIAKHRGPKRAMVALARRIALIHHRMWVDDTDFRSDITALPAG